MAAAKDILARVISGQTVYKTSAAWEYRFIKAEADLRVKAANDGGVEVVGGIAISANRTSLPAHGGVFFDLAMTTLNSNTDNWAEVEVIWDFGTPNAVFHNVERGAYMDKIGRQARRSKGPMAGTVFTKPGVYTVRAFAYDNASGNYAEDSITITVVDPLSLYTAAQTYVCAIDGDFTGAPSADNVYTNPQTALDEFSLTGGNAILLFKAGENFEFTDGASGIMSDDGDDWYIGTWENGKDIWNAGQTDYYYDDDGSMLRIARAGSFAVANLKMRTYYNASQTQTTINGQTVDGGYVGGVANSAEATPFYFGFGGSETNVIDCNHVSFSNCHFEGFQYLRNQCSQAFIVHNCKIINWSSFGIFCVYSERFARGGCTLTVPIDCVEATNQSRDLSLRPLAPLHGPHRSAASLRQVSYNNVVSARSGWFGASSAQPGDRWHTSGALITQDLPRVCAFNDYIIGGDVAYIAEAANPTVQTSRCHFMVIDSLIIECTKHMYDGNIRWSFGNTIFRNVISVIPRIANQGLNALWWNHHLWRNGGPVDPGLTGTAQQIWDADPTLYTDETAWPTDYDWTVQSKGGEWVFCAQDQGVIDRYATETTTNTDAEIRANTPSPVTLDGQVTIATDTSIAFYAADGKWWPLRDGAGDYYSDYNDNVQSIYDESIYSVSMTLINEGGVQSASRNYQHYKNDDGDGNKAFPNDTYENILEFTKAVDDTALESEILLLTASEYDGECHFATDTTTGYFSQDGSWVAGNGDLAVTPSADPNFDEFFNPSSAGTGAVSSNRCMDFFMNVITTETPKLGAVEAGAVY